MIRIGSIKHAVGLKKMANRIYLNLKTSQGRETVDEFEREPAQNYREFAKYVREMANEYRLAGMDVYQSSRACANWKEQS